MEKLQELQPLTLADPLLLLDFVYMCPHADYLELFSRIPPFIAITWLSHKASFETSRITTSDVCYLLILGTWPFVIQVSVWHFFVGWCVEGMDHSH